MRTLAIAVAAALVAIGVLFIAGGGTQLVPAIDVTSIDPNVVFDPVRAGDELPSGFRQLLPRDAIQPIYAPQFVRATDSPWDEETLVIGVELGGEAKAYPISYLNRREMVVDRFGDIPILVTW
jgi:hypothetical protein